MNSIALCDVVNAIDSMSMEDFYEKCITGILSAHEVSKLMTSNMSFLTEADNQKIHKSLASIGLVPEGCKLSDENVEKIIRHMSTRAFARR